MSAPYLRPATKNDMMLYFEWANDPVVRKNAFHTEPICMEEHRAWFTNALANENILMYVLMAGNEPVGQVRIALGNEATISYSVATEYRGKGYGARMLSLMETKVPKPIMLVGQVKKGNTPSRRVFLSLGYGEVLCEGKDYLEYRKWIE